MNTVHYKLITFTKPVRITSAGMFEVATVKRAIQAEAVQDESKNKGQTERHEMLVISEWHLSLH